MGVGSAIAQILGNGLRFGAAIVERLNLPEKRRKAASEALSKEEAARASSAAATSDAVFNGDKGAVNRKVTEILGLACACVTLGLLICGCGKTVAVYVPADREVVPMIRTNGVSAVAGWFVPNATFNDLLKKAQRASDLENEMAVSARMDGKK